MCHTWYRENVVETSVRSCRRSRGSPKVETQRQIDWYEKHCFSMPFDAKSPEMLHIMNHSGAKGKDAKTPGKDAKKGRDTWLKRSKATWCFFWPPSVFESWPPGVLEPWNGLFCKAANQATWPQIRHDLHWLLIHCDFKETNWYIFEWKVDNCTCIFSFSFRSWVG